MAKKVNKAKKGGENLGEFDSLNSAVILYAGHELPS